MDLTMTKNSYKKTAIRQRMALTNESYLEATRQLSFLTPSPWPSLNEALMGGFQNGGMYLVYSANSPSIAFMYEALEKQERIAGIYRSDRNSGREIEMDARKRSMRKLSRTDDPSMFFDESSDFFTKETITRVRKQHHVSPFTAFVLTSTSDYQTILAWKALAQELNVPLIVDVIVSKRTGGLHEIPIGLVEEANGIISCSLSGRSVIHPHEWQVDLVKNRDGATGVITTG
jgi:hypothetical protein